jgi:hypothetical protein
MHAHPLPRHRKTIRLNSVHLSYRMNRIPFRQYWPILFVGFFFAFGLVALLRSRVTAPL